MVLRTLLILKGQNVFGIKNTLNSEGTKKKDEEKKDSLTQVEKGEEKKDSKFQKSFSVCGMNNVSSLFIEKIHI
jgi:hypothetical protein